MTLHVGLGQHIDTILVAEVVEIGIVGVVRSAHSVDVQLLHELHVVLHLLAGHRASSHLAEVMAVDTMNNHPVAVHEEGTVVAHTYGTEAHFGAAYVDGLLAFGKRYRKVVELRALGTPGSDAFDGAEAEVYHGVGSHGRRGQYFAVVGNLGGDGSVTDPRTLCPDGEVSRGCGVSGRERCGAEEVVGNG